MKSQKKSQFDQEMTDFNEDDDEQHQDMTRADMFALNYNKN